MIQFFYGHIQANGRIPLPEEAGSLPAKIAMDRVYAWHQPHQPAAFYRSAYHPRHKTDGQKVDCTKPTISSAARAEALLSCCSSRFKAA